MIGYENEFLKTPARITYLDTITRICVYIYAYYWKHPPRATIVEVMVGTNLELCTHALANLILCALCSAFSSLLFALALPYSYLY